MTFIIMASTLFNFLGCGKVDVSQYKGDGRISPVGEGPITRGYVVEFDTLDLSQAFSKRYRIIDYPMIGKGLSFGLAYRGNESDIEEILGGFLSYRVSTFKNEVIFSCSSELKNWRRGESLVDTNTVEYFFYFMDGGKESFYDPKEMPYISDLNKLYFDIHYDPRSTKKKFIASIQLRVGGSK